MADRSGQLEVEVIQARGLIPKMGSKTIPGRWMGRKGVRDGGRGMGAVGMGTITGACSESVFVACVLTQPPT